MTGFGPPQHGPAGGGRSGDAEPRVLVRHWWNRRWGRMARRDVYIRTDGMRFQLELRAGGTDSDRRARCWFDELDPAIEEAGLHMAADQDWADITAAHTPQAPGSD